MDNAEMLQRIAEWQEAGHVHPLTCRVETCRRNLVGKEVEGVVILVCPACDSTQKFIPPVILSDHVRKMREFLGE